MFGVWFWVFFGLSTVSLVWSTILYERSDASIGTSPTHKCNFKKVCVPFTKRSMFDSSWICCEDNSGWPVSHVIMPFTVMMLTNDFWFSLSVDLLWEVFEVQNLSYFGKFLFTTNDVNQFETAAGALIGDVVCAGILGILMAVALIQVTGWKGLRRDLKNNYIAAKYLVFGAVLAALWFLPAIMTHRVNIGLILATGITVLLILLVGPFVFASSDVIPGNMDPHKEFMRVRFWWAAAVLIIGASSFGYTYLNNDWYQTWLHTYLVLIVLMVANFIKMRDVSASRNKV